MPSFTRKENEMFGGNRKDETTDFHDNDGCLSVFAAVLVGLHIVGFAGWMVFQWL
jgi:hypothetical protein